MLKSWDKDPSSQSYGFSNRHVWMWELDHKEGWAPKKPGLLQYKWSQRVGHDLQTEQQRLVKAVLWYIYIE